MPMTEQDYLNSLKGLTMKQGLHASAYSSAPPTTGLAKPQGPNPQTVADTRANWNGFVVSGMQSYNAYLSAQNKAMAVGPQQENATQPVEQTALAKPRFSSSTYNTAPSYETDQFTLDQDPYSKSRLAFKLPNTGPDSLYGNRLAKQGFKPVLAGGKWSYEL